MEEKRNTIPITVLVMLIKGDKVLLMRRCNTGYEDGKFCFPGGHVEKGEEIKEAAIREAKEEIGIDINKENIKVVNVLERKVKDNAYVDFVLECREWNGDIKIMEEDKCDKITWAQMDNMPDNILSFMRVLFKKDKEFYIPYGWDISDK